MKRILRTGMCSALVLAGILLGFGACGNEGKTSQSSSTEDGSYSNSISDENSETTSSSVHVHSYTLLKSDETGHWYECECGEHNPEGVTAHSGGTATCTAKAVCEVCHTEYGEVDADNHENEEFSYISNGDGTHKKVRGCCGAVEAEAEQCSGGTATCIAKAVCDDCHAEYGELTEHIFTDWDTSDEKYDYKKCATEGCDALDKTQSYKKSVYALNQELWMTQTTFSISLEGCDEYENVVGIKLGEYDLGKDIDALSIPEALKSDTQSHGRQKIEVTVKCADNSEHVVAVPVTLITKAIASADDFKALQITADNKAVYGYYVMTSDINLVGANGTYYDWEATTGFFGTLDGAGHTISAAANGNGNGILSIVRSATIKNVTIKDNWRSGINCALLAKGTFNSLLKNVTFTWAAGNAHTEVGSGWGWICYAEFSNNTLKNVTVNDSQGYGSLFGNKFNGNVFDNVVINGTYTEMGRTGEGVSVGYDDVTKADAVEKVVLEGRQDFILEGGTVSALDLGRYADATVVSVRTSTGFELNGLSSSLATEAFKAAKQSHGEQNFIVVAVTEEGKTVEITVPVTVITKAISTMAELQDAVKHTTGKDDIYGYYTLANDVAWTEEGFTAVEASGGWSGDKAFRGTLDGRGHTITTNSSQKSYGLFGTINGATIKNVTITDVRYSGGENTPILARNAYNMTLENVQIAIVGGNNASAGTADNTPLVGNTMQKCVLKNVTFTSSVSLVNVFANQSGNTFENVTITATVTGGFSEGAAETPEGVTIRQTTADEN